jgi:hypothetical protein
LGEALLWAFHNARSGLCFPSYDRIADGGKPMTKRATKNAAATDTASKAADKPAVHELTPIEAEAVNAYVVAGEKRGPRLKVVSKGKNEAKTAVDHPDEAIGTLALMRAIGTTDLDFFNGLIRHLINASKQDEASEGRANFMLSVVKGIEPRDQVEAMLAAQMAAVHMASMTLARRLANAEMIPQQDSAQNGLAKLTRTFATQVEALKRYRSSGEQKMTVQHVHVADGGQAIVGNVNAPAEGVGAHKKTKDQPHALAYAPGVEMPRQIEAEREAVPVTGRAGL